MATTVGASVRLGGAGRTPCPLAGAVGRIATSGSVKVVCAAAGGARAGAVARAGVARGVGVLWLAVAAVVPGSGGGGGSTGGEGTGM